MPLTLFSRKVMSQVSPHGLIVCLYDSMTPFHNKLCHWYCLTQTPLLAICYVHINFQLTVIQRSVQHNTKLPIMENFKVHWLTFTVDDFFKLPFCNLVLDQGHAHISPNSRHRVHTEIHYCWAKY